MLSISRDLTKLTYTPKLLWVPEQFIQMNMPLFTEIHWGDGPLHSKQLSFDGSPLSNDLFLFPSIHFLVSFSNWLWWLGPYLWWRPLCWFTSWALFLPLALAPGIWIWRRLCYYYIYGYGLPIIFPKWFPMTWFYALIFNWFCLFSWRLLP